MNTRAQDDVKPYPLGEPIRDEAQEQAERWEPVDPSRPYLQRSTTTGMMRNVKPEPPAQFPLIWNLGGHP